MTVWSRGNEGRGLAILVLLHFSYPILERGNTVLLLLLLLLLMCHAQATPPGF